MTENMKLVPDSLISAPVEAAFASWLISPSINARSVVPKACAIKARPGTMVFAPRDVAHSFTIDSDQVRILVMVSPAGAEGFFKECSVPAPSMTLPPPAETPYSEIQKMMALAPTYGFEFVRPGH